MRDLLRAEQDILIILSSDIRGKDIATIVKLGQSHHKVKFMLLGDYANSRGAADMGLYPDLLPGYTPVSSAGNYSEYGANLPKSAGLDIAAMIEAAKSGKLGALYIVGANPLPRYNVKPGELKNTFIVVQDMFLT